MTNTDQLRQAMREAGPMHRTELVDATGLESDAVSKLLFAGKQRGEFLVRMLDGKAAYELNPDYVPVGKGRGGGRPRRDGAPARRQATPTPAPTPAPAPAAATPAPAPAPAAAKPEATPGEVLSGFARSASAMADETLERAVRIPVAPAIVLQLTKASRSLHQAALALAGGAS